MKFEFPNNFDDAQEVKSAQDDTEAIIKRVQEKVSPEKVEKDELTKAEEFLDKPGELTEDEALELARVLQDLDLLAEKKLADNTEQPNETWTIGGKSDKNGSVLPATHKAVRRPGEYT